MSVLTDTFELANGVKIPKVGFGTWQTPAGDVAYQAVRNALKVGYRHIDTAKAYGNEEDVGRAVRDSGIARDQIFVTSKLPAHSKTYDEAMADFESTFKKLNIDYVDLYLVHAHGHGMRLVKIVIKEMLKFGGQCKIFMLVAELRQLGFQTLMCMILKMCWLMQK